MQFCSTIGCPVFAEQFESNSLSFCSSCLCLIICFTDEKLFSGVNDNFSSPKTNYQAQVRPTYRKIASSNTSHLEAHVGLLRLLMKGIFGTYVL